MNTRKWVGITAIGKVEPILMLIPSPQILQVLFWYRNRPSDVTVPRMATWLLARPVYLRARTIQIVVLMSKSIPYKQLIVCEFVREGQNYVFLVCVLGKTTHYL